MRATTAPLHEQPKVLQPSTTHGANMLTPDPAKQCYHCQGLGHVQADCPTLRLSGGTGGGRCYSCGQMGHLAVRTAEICFVSSTNNVQRNCPAPNSAPIGRGAGGPPRGGYGGGFRGGYAGNNRAATCYKCGGPNHFARDCQAQAMKCYACGKLGHISRDCTAPNGGPLQQAGKTCYRCGETGHISRECPQAQDGVNGDAATSPATGAQTETAPVTQAAIAA